MRAGRRLLLLAVGLVAVGCGSSDGSTATTALPVDEFAILDAVLVDDETVAAVLAGAAPSPEYSSNPPTSGARSSQWARCGVYRQPIPDLFQVASLARGAVIVQYQSRLTADARDNLEGVVRGLGDGLIVAPREDLPATVVITAWGRMLQMSLLDSGRMEAFAAQYGGRGPSPGACPATVDES